MSQCSKRYVRSYGKDGGYGPAEVGHQGQASSHPKRLLLRVVVVPCKHINLTDSIDVIQWKGKYRNSFNTMVIDQKNLKYVYSSIDQKETTFDNGKLEQI